MTQPRTRVLVLADAAARAATIEASLREQSDLQVIVGRPRALRDLSEEHDPAVVVLATTTARAASALATMAGALRAPPVVLLADDPRRAWTAAARRAGVHAVLPSDAPAVQITAAITAARAGLLALPPDILRPATVSTVGGGQERALTPREREILEMMAEGLSNRLIARRLGISSYTVKFHVASLLAKLRAGSRTEAVTLGVRAGLISL